MSEAAQASDTPYIDTEIIAQNVKSKAKTMSLLTLFLALTFSILCACKVLKRHDIVMIPLDTFHLTRYDTYIVFERVSPDRVGGENMGRQLTFADTPVTDEKVLGAFASTEEWLSRNQIAKRLLRKKTPSLIARIERLVDEGHLRRGETELPNGNKMFWYQNPIEYDTPPF